MIANISRKDSESSIWGFCGLWVAAGGPWLKEQGLELGKFGPTFLLSLILIVYNEHVTEPL